MFDVRVSAAILVDTRTCFALSLPQFFVRCRTEQAVALPDNAFSPRWLGRKTQMTHRFTLVILVAVGLLSGCASLPPGADFKKTESSALPHPEQTRFGRHFDQMATAHNGNSGFRLISNGVDGLLTRAQMINSAEKTLDLQYFIFRADQTGLLLTDALLHTADRGVRVRLLIDDVDTMAGDGQIRALDAHPNIEVRIFNPFLYRGHAEVFKAAEFMLNKPRLDYRMHNKLFVVDNSIALIGGRNGGDEYFQIDPEAQLGDDDLFTAGPLVKQLSATFDEFWQCALSIPIEALAGGKPTGQELDAFRALLESHRQQLKEDGVAYATRIASGEPFADIISGKLPLVWAHAQLVYDSPEKRRVEKGEMVGRLMHRAVADAASAANTELLMISPYFIPGADGMQLLKTLRERKVRVAVLTNSLIGTNELAAYAGYTHYRVPLLEDNVELYELRALLGNAQGSGQTKKMTQYGNYALHAKLFVFDRQKVYIGSMNFDQRSEHLNTEIGLIIDSPELAQQTAARFESLVQPANSYALALRRDTPDATPRLLWRTVEDGKLVELDKEPARDGWRRFKATVLSLLPLDREL
jgi:putative cardiolipin synthase